MGRYHTGIVSEIVNDEDAFMNVSWKASFSIEIKCVILLSANEDSEDKV